VGEKTAAKLINTYGDLDGIFAHVDEQTPKLRENLAAHEDRVRKNAEVMVLVRDVPPRGRPDGLDPRDRRIDPTRCASLFDFLEFRTLYDRLAEALGPSA
jgi:DNA polymerase I